ncbi:hypothetical protein EKO27_g9151 [Xylaria grammica]|uniref:Uncharacterized protein n=1 Tax=Xylaria grammica TaxID=363999 RepID=A0A439CUV1_9PEZI|nr:hypothetical protein EKO27_g9151 [Xylaria grammica]
MASPAWFYEFTRAPPIPADSDIVEKDFAGAFHLVGLLYAFGNLDVWPWDWTDADRSLSAAMRDAYVRFVRAGTPAAGLDGSETWLPLSADRPVSRIWDGDGALRLEPLSSHTSEVVAFWDRYYGVEL